MSNDVTAEIIREALKGVYKSPEWYLSFEVGNSAGMDCKRHADAVAINAYPSKGFETRGFEIKVSKQDLAAELKNGIKSDEIARFCDFWFLVVPKGLTDDATLPPTWGVIEYHDGKLRQKIKAQKLDRAEPTAGFLCAMLRARERSIFAEAVNMTQEHAEQIRRSAGYQYKHDVRELQGLREKLKEIKEATGISLENWTPPQSIIRKLKAARSIEIIAQNIADIEHAAKRLERDVQEIKTAIAEMNTGE